MFLDVEWFVAPGQKIKFKWFHQLWSHFHLFLVNTLCLHSCAQKFTSSGGIDGLFTSHSCVILLLNDTLTITLLFLWLYEIRKVSAALDESSHSNLCRLVWILSGVIWVVSVGSVICKELENFHSYTQKIAEKEILQGM